MTEAEIKDAASIYAWNMIAFDIQPSMEQSFIAGAEENAPKWIPIMEQLPEEGEYVLVLIGVTWFKGRLMSNGWTAFFADGDRLCGGFTPVTHWMPESILPSPPNTQP